MKKAIYLTVLSFLFLTLNCSCSNDDSNNSGNNVPTNGWRIGATNYTTFLCMRNIGEPNSVGAFDVMPGTNGLNSVIVLFNNISGIAAGTYKVVTKPDQSDLLADEIMVSMSTNYDEATGNYERQYVTELAETVNAIVTINDGKVRIEVPQINIISYPITTDSVTSNFAGTIIEQ